MYEWNSMARQLDMQFIYEAQPFFQVLGVLTSCSWPARHSDITERVVLTSHQQRQVRSDWFWMKSCCKQGVRIRTEWDLSSNSLLLVNGISEIRMLMWWLSRPAIPHTFRVRLQQLPSLMRDTRLRLLPYFQNIFALIETTLYMLSLSKDCPNLNFHCPICQSHSIALLLGWQVCFRDIDNDANQYSALNNNQVNCQLKHNTT